MPVAPGVKSQAIGADTFSGWLTLADIKPGLYQISVSQNAWIDVAQSGAVLHSKAFTGARECKVLHKSVRFEIGSGPLTIEISGAPAKTVLLTVRAAN